MEALLQEKNKELTFNTGLCGERVVVGTTLEAVYMLFETRRQQDKVA